MPSRDRSSLAPMDVSSRLGRLRDRLGEAGCDALLVTNLRNVRYLTGFTGSAGMLLVAPDSALLTTDGRYKEQSAEQLASAGVQAEIAIGRLGEQFEALDRASRGLNRLGCEASEVTLALRETLESSLRLVSSGGRLVPTRGLVEGLRRVKDAGELARIELAADIADVALAQVKERLAA
ncbi:MAG TPA: aminopeptidase P family N-terminal domain-containing protein, partial [Acidimicrobiales bacterium]|nr:aminopeptidase P family N-terminal domain-containing protein [Acidimicrobiales bacterium]